MRVIKLDNRKVVVSENGVSRVLTPPSGVSFSEATQRWNAWIINSETNGWASRSFGIHKHGAIGAFEQAMEAREESLNFLLNRRLLPRIRRAYEIREIKGLFYVRDPIEKKYRTFSTLQHAANFNAAITEKWIETYTFDISSAIQMYFGDNGRPKRKMSFDHLTRIFHQQQPSVH